MAGKYVLAQGAFESLVAHLVELEDNKKMLVDKFFPEITKEREEFITLFDKYLKEINDLIKNATVREDSGQDFPFVTIGSQVTLKDLATGESETMRIVIPFNYEVDSNDVSYLSPVGKSLLLKKVGDVVEVQAPGGKFKYEIEAIKFP